MGWQDVAAGSHVCQPKPMSVGLGLRPRYYLLVGALSASAEALLLAGESEHDQEPPQVQTFQAHRCKAALV